MKRLGRWKVYLDRSRMYIGYAQFFAIIFIFLKSYEDTSFGVWFFDHIILTFPVFAVLFFSVSIVVGYLDKKYIRPHEQKEITSTNPIHMEILDKVKKL